MITHFSDFGYVHLFWRYSHSKSKVVRNRVEFLTPKFREFTPTTLKVICVNARNFKLNCKCSPLKFLGDPRPGL